MVSRREQPSPTPIGEEEAVPHHRQSILRNRLLRAMAPEDFARLQPHLEPIALQLREVVIGADAAVDEDRHGLGLDG